jgi:hypothetical protein
LVDLVDKWEGLWKDFESARKSEWLKAKEAGKFAAMMKQVKPMKELCAALDAGIIDVQDAIGKRKGKTQEEAPLFLKSYVSKMNVLRKSALKAAAKASLDEMDKATKPNTYRALKVLMTGIDEVVSLAEYNETVLKKNCVEMGKTLTKEEMVAKVQSMALGQVKKGAMKSLACLQKVKANPTPAEWSSQMNSAMTRDLIMGLVSLVGAQAKGGFGNIPNANRHKTLADPWNTGQPTSAVTAQDTPAIILQKAKAWGAVVKGVVTDYQAHW